MLRFPLAIKGLVFAPALICLFFLFKAFCPSEGGESCLADQFAVPIFLPLIAIHKIFGDSSVLLGQEFIFIMFYWALAGFLVGLFLDILGHKGGSSGTEQPKISVTTSPESGMKFIKPTPPKAPAKKLPLNLLDREEYQSL